MHEHSSDAWDGTSWVTQTYPLPKVDRDAIERWNKHAAWEDVVDAFNGIPMSDETYQDLLYVQYLVDGKRYDD